MFMSALFSIFGDRYNISVESMEQQGVRYRITIQDEEKDKDV